VKLNYDNFLLLLIRKNVFRKIQRIRLERSLHQCIGRDSERTSVPFEVLSFADSCTLDPNLFWFFIPLFARDT